MPFAIVTLAAVSRLARLYEEQALEELREFQSLGKFLLKRVRVLCKGNTETRMEWAWKAASVVLEAKEMISKDALDVVNKADGDHCGSVEDLVEDVDLVVTKKSAKVKADARKDIDSFIYDLGLESVTSTKKKITDENKNDSVKVKKSLKLKIATVAKKEIDSFVDDLGLDVGISVKRLKTSDNELKSKLTMEL